MTGRPRVVVTGNTSRSAPRWAALYRTITQSSSPEAAIIAASGRWWLVTPSRRTTPSACAARRYSTTPPEPRSVSHSSAPLDVVEGDDVDVVRPDGGEDRPKFLRGLRGSPGGELHAHHNPVALATEGGDGGGERLVVGRPLGEPAPVEEVDPA